MKNSSAVEFPSLSHHRDPSRKNEATAADRRVMANLGLKQETNRIFKQITIIMFGCTIIATGQVIFTSSHLVVDRVGTAGLFWGFLLVASIFWVVYNSIAEMASIHPTAGGQYTWISMFAPRRLERYLSYEIGWLTSIGWTSGIVSISSLLVICVQGIIALHDPDYTPENWHSTLLIIAIVVLAIFFNICLAKWLPYVEAGMALICIGGILAACLVLWLLLPLNNPHDAFLQFTNNTDWASDGVSFMTSLLYPILSLLGFDCPVHMSEETQNASTSTPKAIIISYAASVSLGFLVVVTLIFTWGNASSVKSDVPFIHLIHIATQNYAATTALVLILTLPLFGSVIACKATASRQVWALSRDFGFPCSEFISRIHPRFEIPLNAILVSFLVCVILSLVNLGSPEAFNAMLSLNQGAVLGSYIIAIGCKIYARTQGSLPESLWSLGKYGLYIDVLAVLLLAPLFVFAMFPGSGSVSAGNMNWGILLFGSVFLLSTIYFLLKGKRSYVSPRQHKERMGAEVAL